MKISHDHKHLTNSSPTRVCNWHHKHLLNQFI